MERDHFLVVTMRKNHPLIIEKRFSISIYEKITFYAIQLFILLNLTFSDSFTNYYIVVIVVVL